MFSAGADLNWMSAITVGDYDDQVADSERLDDLFHAIHSFPAPVLARINGHALAGALGLVACADIAVAVRGAKFGFTEAKLGLALAVISPCVQPKIGLSNALRYFLSGEVFDADRALDICLIHEVCERERLDATMERVVNDLLAGGPRAQRKIKELIRKVENTRTLVEARQLTVSTIAQLRMSDEGQSGMKAFLRQQPMPSTKHIEE